MQYCKLHIYIHLIKCDLSNFKGSSKLRNPQPYVSHYLEHTIKNRGFTVCIIPIPGKGACSLQKIVHFAYIQTANYTSLKITKLQSLEVRGWRLDPAPTCLFTNAVNANILTFVLPCKSLYIFSTPFIPLETYFFLPTFEIWLG